MTGWSPASDGPMSVVRMTSVVRMARGSCDTLVVQGQMIFGVHGASVGGGDTAVGAPRPGA